MTTMRNDAVGEIRLAVQEHYGQRARRVIELADVTPVPDAGAGCGADNCGHGACGDEGCGHNAVACGCGAATAEGSAVCCGPAATASDGTAAVCCGPATVSDGVGVCCGPATVSDGVGVCCGPATTSDSNAAGCGVGAVSDGGAVCCGPADLERAVSLYNEAQLQGLPVAAMAASAGCGNPTALADLRPGERVLDLGSGGGIDCFIAAEQVGESGRVFGLDMTPDMLALANANRERMGLTNVEFIEGHLEDIPLPDGSVDVVISNCVICLSPDKDAVFREAWRVLAPGGRLHVSDMLALSEEGPRVTDAEAWASCVGGAEYRGSYLARMAAAGFADIATVEEALQFDEEAIPLNVASVKVSARKPA